MKSKYSDRNMPVILQPYGHGDKLSISLASSNNKELPDPLYQPKRKKGKKELPDELLASKLGTTKTSTYREKI